MKVKAIIYTSVLLLTIFTFSSCSDDGSPLKPEPKIRVISPNGGEVWNRGGQRPVVWENDVGGDVCIELLKSGELYITLADTVSGMKGEFLWDMPKDMPVSGDYSIRIISIPDPGEKDESDGYFRTGWPLLSIYDPPNDIAGGEINVQWYGNSNDSTDLTYYYCITTDTLMADSEAVSVLSPVLWRTTSNNYAGVSFPVLPLNSSQLFTDSTAYTSGELTITVRVVFSRFFLYARDAYGAVSPVVSKVFGRMNNPPFPPTAVSYKLGIKDSGIWTTVGSDSTLLILPKPSTGWDPIDFKWKSIDPDGAGVKLEYKWELWERERVNNTDNMISLAASSDGWSPVNTSVSFSGEIWNHNNRGQYAFKIFVRDDALEEARSCATINFEVFPPSFEKGILLIDDTDPALYNSQLSGGIYMGNPAASSVTAHYEEILRHSGYLPENEAPDSLSLFRITKFEKSVVLAGWDYIYYDDDDDPSTPEVIVDSVAIYRGVYKPDLQELVQYRLVIIASDDRGNLKGVDFSGEPPYKGYNRILSQYLDVGGKNFVLGPSVLMGKCYSSPDQIPINKYLDPFMVVFDGYIPSAQGFDSTTELFFNKYFGISSMIFPEQKTYYTANSALQLCSDHYMTDNYDFIGSTVYEHITDPMIKPLRVDSTQVRLAWWDRTVGTRIQKLALKDRGTVFTGIPTFELCKGESVYRYQSIYDLPLKDENYSYEVNGADTLKHFLWNWDYVKDSLTVIGGQPVPVLRRSGTVAGRYAEENGLYRTAFFGLPVYFMDNTDNQVSDMFKTMIEWFDLSKDPADGWKKK